MLQVAERPSRIDLIPPAVGHVFAMAGETDIAALARAFDVHNGETTRTIRALSGTVESIMAEVEKVSGKIAALQVTGGGAAAKTPSVALAALNAFAHQNGVQKFSDYVEAKVKAGEIRAEAFIGSDPDGGFTVLPDVDTTIRSAAREVNPMRALAGVMTTNKAEVVIIVDPSESDAEWVGEREARPETAGPQLKDVKIPTHEIYANPKASQSLIDDSSADIAGWLVGSVSRRFATKEGSAFFSGDGVQKPIGFLSYETDTAEDFARPFAKIQYVATGATSPTDVQIADALIAASLKLRTPYRANATWVMGRETARVIRQLRDQQDRPLWSADGTLVAGQPDRLLGWPVAYSDDMPAIGANAFPIAVGDFKQGYLIVDRIGIRVLRDPYTAKPYVQFYTTKRVGGSVVDFNAIKLVKWATS